MSGRNWILFFLFLLGAGLASALIPVFFNAERQTTLEELGKEEVLWGNQKLLDYTLLVRVKSSGLGASGTREPERFKFRVRDGRLVEAAKNGEFLALDQLERWDIPGLFGRLRKYRETAGKRDYLSADFHKKFGYPIHWIWVDKKVSPPLREEVDLVLERG